MSETDTERPGVQFIEEPDGRVTARHTESGVASFGESESDALRELADALESHYGEGDSIEDLDAYVYGRNIDVPLSESDYPSWLDTDTDTTEEDSEPDVS